MSAAPREVEAMGDGAIRWLRDPLGDPRALLDALRALPGVLDAVVTEAHALVTFDPSRPVPAPWTAEEDLPRHRVSPAREHLVRARYDGPDLDEVAARTGLSRAEVVRAHAGAEYVVRVVGFLPGFAYLGPLPPALDLPRRATPRPRVEPGSVAIAAAYTGVYPFASPGGWHLIGTALDFTPFEGEHGARFALGDRVRFEEVR
ncbi:MAG TPA: carboxyltransferase domain-containing protein [Polyangiaceae bacterium]|jgi:UPF0271 protein